MRSVKFLKQIYRFLLFSFLFSISIFLSYIFFHLAIPQSFHQPPGQQHGQQLSFSDTVLVKLKKEEEIPRIVHQTYSSRNLPLKYAAWQKSCIDLHPNWEFKLWTDQDLDDLVQNEYPWLLERYTGFSNWVNRVDLARYMILYKYGGFFIDLDIECLDSLERFAKMGGALFPRMSFNTSTAIAFWEYNFPNSFLGSIPGHVIWKDAMLLISNSKKQGVERLTGSIFIYALIHRYREIEISSADELFPEIHVLDPGTLL